MVSNLSPFKPFPIRTNHIAQMFPRAEAAHTFPHLIHSSPLTEKPASSYSAHHSSIRVSFTSHTVPSYPPFLTCKSKSCLLSSDVPILLESSSIRKNLLAHVTFRLQENTFAFFTWNQSVSPRDSESIESISMLSCFHSRLHKSFTLVARCLPIKIFRFTESTIRITCHPYF